MRQRAAFVAAGWLVCASAAFGQWQEQHKLQPQDNSIGDHCGSSVAVSGGLALVGAAREQPGGVRSGSAYLFDCATGVELAKWAPADGAFDDEFGRALAMRGDLAAIGAHNDDDMGEDSGSVYLIEVSTGQELRKIVAPNGAADDEFGAAVAVFGSTVLVGAPFADRAGGDAGAAYLFDAISGALLAELTGAGVDGSDRFGASVALSADLALVGAPQAFGTGAVFVFDAASGHQLAVLTADDGGAGDLFGAAVAVSGMTAVVGAPSDDDLGMDAGAAYVFDLNSGAQLGKLLPSNGVSFVNFGTTAALDGMTAVIGAPPFRTGVAYEFDLTTGEQVRQLVPSDAVRLDKFGLSLAIEGTTVVAGRSNRATGDPSRWDGGAAYVFSLLPCAPDLDSNGRTNTLDVLLFLGLWSAGDPAADWNGDGTVNTLDFEAYLNDWAAGCP